MFVSSQSPARKGTRRVEQILLLAGCFGLLYLTFVLTQRLRAQAASRSVSAQAAVGQRAPDERPVLETASGATAYGATASGTGSGAVIGRLQIPQLGLSVPLIDGVSDTDLQRGAGHIPGTALPGGLGTVGVAAHRDTFFRPLRRVVPGMEVLAAGPAGTYHYQVQSAEVVSPQQVSVLDLADTPQLTLITCFPFNFIGSAPQRFVVRARLVSLDPGS